MSLRVAFLGLGTMGAPMARRLATAGFSLAVYNRSRGKAEPFAQLGARVCETPAQAVIDAEVVCSMVSDPAALEAISRGPEGALTVVRAGAVWVELSTVGVEALVPLREALEARGASLVDAPVSGSREPAERGTLLVLAGGSPAAIDFVEPVLSTFGVLRRTGGSGTGAATKLVFNQLGAHMLAGLVSGLVLGVKLGLDPRALLASIDEGAFRSAMYAQKGARIVERRFSPADFSVDLLLKDQRLVLEAAHRLDVELPTLEAICALIERAAREGEGDHDLCAVVRVLERMAGVIVGERGHTA
jgi:3-hydroxyisobutyrate dehydrogenase-like beta-hydroxyacid dehydrogenase